MANLITIDEYKNYKGINSEQYDPIISSLISAVSNFIKEYTNRSLIDWYNTSKVEYFDAVSYPDYFPLEFPLVSVSEVAVSADGGVTFTPLIENTDYFVDKVDNRIINNTVYYGFTNSTIKFHSGKITYKAGYVDTPMDLKIATMDMVEYYRKQEYKPSQSMGSATTDNPVVFLKGNQLPAHIKRVLDLYRVL